MAKTSYPLIVGNWKMNGLTADLREMDRLVAWLRAMRPRIKADIMLCPPATLLMPMNTRCGALRARNLIWLGGQDCHMRAQGAFTGDVSAAMLRDAGARAVILGHSERRDAHQETNKQIAQKCETAQAHGLMSIICVGESLAERKANKARSCVQAQLRASLPPSALCGGGIAQNLAIAYEPIWAIGTGLTPTLDEIVDMHATIRKHLMRRNRDGMKVRLLYGGSVSPKNGQEILALPNVDGALVGGASLKASDFRRIIGASQHR